ncbi:MAG TPA: PPC domain-containing protein [Planctomycetota bacterium]|nr:PPC domain-containing protein [Planctomycetota bacterium]
MKSRVARALLVLLIVVPGGGAAAAPRVARADPPAAIPGRTCDVTFHGDGLADAVSLWTSFPSEAVVAPATDGAGGRSVTFRVTVPRGVPPGIGAARVGTLQGVSNIALLLVDDLAAARCAGRNGAPDAATLLDPPTAIDGVCANEASRWYSFEARAGERIDVEVAAARLGSALDPLLRILDPSGREAILCDDTPGSAPDLRTGFTARSAGRHLLEIRDAAHGGGPEHRFRLRLGGAPFRGNPLPLREAPAPEPEPNDTRETSVPVTVPSSVAGLFDRPGDRDWYRFNARKGERIAFVARSRSLGFEGDVYLSIHDAEGKRLVEANLAGIGPLGEGAVEHVFAAEGAYYLLAEEVNLGGGPGHEYRLECRPLGAGFALTAQAESFSGPAGGEIAVQVECVRAGHEGPVEIALAGEPRGLRILEPLLPRGKKETAVRIVLPADLAPGEVIPFRLEGRVAVGDRTLIVPVSTLPVLRTLFPRRPFPPAFLDGAMAAGAVEKVRAF